MRKVARLVLRPVMRGWGRQIVTGLNRGPVPNDQPRAHASGTDSDRILLFGAGIAVGWGVLSHGLALPGALARALSAHTRRGTDVEVISDGSFTAARSVDELVGVELERFDAIIVTLGLTEAITLASPREWRRDVDRLLEYLTEHINPGATIYLVGIHLPTIITPFDAIIAPVLARQTTELNAITRELSDRRESVHFLAYDPPRREADTRSRTPDDYREGGAALAAIIAPQLDQRFTTVVRTRQIRNEALRQAALDALEIVDTGPEARFDRIVNLARRAFGTSSAALTIIDHDRQWMKSTDGIERNDLPRDLSICATTIEQPAELVIGDLAADSRFAGFAWSDDEPVRFYAGFPIEAPGGERIGALCVFDSQVRDPADFDRALLRDLALMVQDEVWQSSNAV